MPLAANSSTTRRCVPSLDPGVDNQPVVDVGTTRFDEIREDMCLVPDDHREAEGLAPGHVDLGSTSSLRNSIARNAGADSAVSRPLATITNGTRRQARTTEGQGVAPRRSVILVSPPRLPDGTPPGAPARACHRRRGFASSRNAAASQADPLGRSRLGTVSTRARPRQSRPPPAARHPRSRQEPATPRYGRPSLLGGPAGRTASRSVGSGPAGASFSIT